MNAFINPLVGIYSNKGSDGLAVHPSRSASLSFRLKEASYEAELDFLLLFLVKKSSIGLIGFLRHTPNTPRLGWLSCGYELVSCGRRKRQLSFNWLLANNNMTYITYRDARNRIGKSMNRVYSAFCFFLEKEVKLPRS
jgi:hypothetical protein